MFATLNTHTHVKILTNTNKCLIRVFVTKLQNSSLNMFLSVVLHIPIDECTYMWFKKQNLAIDRGSESGCQVRLCLLLLLFVCLSLLGIFMIIISILMVWPRRYMYVVLLRRRKRTQTHTNYFVSVVCVFVFFVSGI